MGAGYCLKRFVLVLAGGFRRLFLYHVTLPSPAGKLQGLAGVLEFVWEFPASAGSSWPMLKFVWALHLWTPWLFILRKAAMSRNVVVGWRRFE